MSEHGQVLSANSTMLPASFSPADRIFTIVLADSSAVRGKWCQCGGGVSATLPSKGSSRAQLNKEESPVSVPFLSKACWFYQLELEPRIYGDSAAIPLKLILD